MSSLQHIQLEINMNITCLKCNCFNSENIGGLSLKDIHIYTEPSYHD